MLTLAVKKGLGIKKNSRKLSGEMKNRPEPSKNAGPVSREQKNGSMLIYTENRKRGLGGVLPVNHGHRHYKRSEAICGLQ